MKAVILCAGKGERLKPLTDSIPKPMILINENPLLWYTIQLLKKHNIKDIAINLSYLPEKIKDYFSNGEKFGVNIRYSYEPELLGTAGALNNFRDFLNETFVVIYGDNLTDLNLKEILDFHKKKRALATIFTVRWVMADKNTTPGWIIFDENNKIKEMIENPTEENNKRLENEKRKQNNAGIYILEPEILNYIPKGYSDFPENIFPELLKRGKNLYAYQQNCYFKELGQTSRYLKAKEEIESRKIKLNL